MRTSKKAIFVVMLLVFALVLGACGAGNTNNNNSGGDQPKEKTKIRLSIGAGHSETGMAYTKAANEFFIPEISKRVEAETDYTIEWTTAWSGSVAKLAEVTTAVQNGLLDIGVAAITFEGSAYTPHAIMMYLPFSSGDPYTINKVMETLYKEFPEAFTAELGRRNQTLVGLGCTGVYQLLTKFPVKDFSDLKGHSLACAGANKYWIDGTGATSIQSNLTEAYQSLQTGLYEGWVINPASGVGYKLQEQTKYLLVCDYGAIAGPVITINNDKLKSLPEEVRKIIMEVGDEYTHKAEPATVVQTEEDAMKQMEAEGVTITVLDDTQKKLYVDSLDNTPKVFAETLKASGIDGYAIIERALELFEENGYTQIRDWASEWK